MSDIYTDPPQSRNEAIIKSTIDGTQYTDPPQSRMEDLLLELKETIEQGGGGTTVVANPEGEATDDLEKLQVGSDIYEIPKDYDELDNKPSINSVELDGNKTANELGLQPTLDGAQTVSGNPITVADAEAMNAESVVVELEPKQDLHGYDAPWVGGAGKNKLLPPQTTTVVENLTFTPISNDGNVEGSIVSGTSSGRGYCPFILPIKNVDTTYYLTVFEMQTGAQVYIWDITANTNINYDGHTIIVPANHEASVGVIASSGFVFNDSELIIMASETQITEFEPYSNICPISGYSEVNVEVSGDNLVESTLPYTIDLDGTRYGGTLDVTEGGYSDEWGTHTLDYVSLEDGLFTASASNNVKGDVFAQAKCNRMKTWASVDDLDDNYGIAYSNNTFYMNLPPECGTTASEVDDWLGENPVRVVYLKKTPSSISTTPTDIPLLENTNNISTDGTNITLKYQPNNVIGECKAYTDEQIEKIATLKNATLLDTVTTFDATTDHTYDLSKYRKILFVILGNYSDASNKFHVLASYDKIELDLVRADTSNKSDNIAPSIVIQANVNTLGGAYAFLEMYLMNTADTFRYTKSADVWDIVQVKVYGLI